MQRGSNLFLVCIGHLMEKGYNNSLVLRLLTFTQPGTSPRRAIAVAWSGATRPHFPIVSGLAVSAHNAASGRYSSIKHRLHYLLLVTTCGQADTETLPVATCPFQLLRKS